MPFDQQILDELAISESEYEMIIDKLGREPNSLELGLFGSLWSEHCGYKHSKPLLRAFSSDSPRLLVKAGEENAGVVDIGEGLAVVFKIESHNHPSAIEPYQGAATGVGGIVRDIFAMGARPIALLNSLRFGPLKENRNSYLFDGVVHGISGYGNCIGVPNVGGEVNFDKSYSGNPLVNAMCIGLLKTEQLVRATAGESGNLLVLVGSGTGRDGIHGASGLASRTFEDDRELRPTVQVGNPFLEKVLIEACLEVSKSGEIDGLQDLGAAGLTSAVVECASNGGVGVELYVDKIPRRDKGMEPYEVMLSETQERMLISIKPDKLAMIKEVFDRWDVECNVVGRSITSEAIRIFDKEVLIADVPIKHLVSPPLYRLSGEKPRYIDATENYDLASVPIPLDPEQTLKNMLRSQNLASRHIVFRRYDHQVQTGTVIGPGGDGALIRVETSSKGLAAATDGNGRLCYLDPYLGGMIAVAEACRNVSCSGAEPIALTNCLNFGNPENPEIYYQLENCINGMAAASDLLNVPVISGNVSLYNETQGGAIYPTPVVGSVGLSEDVSKTSTLSFKDAGDCVVLLGGSGLLGDVDSFAGSEYLDVIHGVVAGVPRIDMVQEVKVQKLVRSLVNDQIIKSSHDCSDGGLIINLVESSIAGGLGFEGSFDVLGRWDACLFGEIQSRIVVSFAEENESKLYDACNSHGIDVLMLGHVGTSKFALKDVISMPMDTLENIWKSGLDSLINDTE
tara:strand:- start:800 stop:3013 length:2214 start_codon:yes stop_codon:yes gene_type:complete